ncbi:MAG: T9SS type A sorting domain-containing protein [Flavobacteriales bacterium]|jgi:uncharacterized delta-60 repeat protein|nr:T9SS type A sorting domain-containing protein [Flavobacteriales bacterium]
MKKQSIYLGLSVILFTHVALAQQPGDLDLAFGTDGIATYHISDSEDQIVKLLVQTDGNILCLGKTQASLQVGNIFLTRFLTSGEMDASFGQDGVTVIDPSTGIDVGNDMVIQGDGRIVVAGYASPQIGIGPLLARFNANGQLDNSFGDNGIVVINTLEFAIIQKVEILQNGKLLCIAKVGDDIALFRFVSDGTWDQSFGIGGIVIVDIGSEYHTCTDLMVVENSGFFVSGSSGLVVTEQAALVCKFLADGTLDSDFNSVGWSEFTVNQSYLTNQARHIGMTLAGDLIVAGDLYGSSSGEGFVTRLNSGGPIDMTFGNAGVFGVELGTGYDLMNAMTLQPDEKILFSGGTSDIGSENDFFVLRINEDGSPDPTFGDNGVVITEVSSGNNQINDMKLQPDGKLVVGGTARIGNNDEIVLARYHTGLNTSVKEPSHEGRLSLYPNPTSGTLTITAETGLDYVELLDALGSTVLTTWTINTDHLQLDLSDLPDGMYLLRASDGKQITSQKVVKQ